MSADVVNKILIKRFTLSGPKQQRAFLYNWEDSSLELVPTSDARAEGWLLDGEVVIKGPREVLFVDAYRGRRIVLGGKVFPIPESQVLHTRGMLTSRFTVSNGFDECSVVYLTPWWRLILDDGSHPDLQFPLEAFARKYS